MIDKLDVLMTGVGGQGIILSSDVLAEAALAAGYDVKKTDVHGMAQRGGAVTSHVRIGLKVASPLIEEGQADILLAFEKLEAVRWTAFLKPGAIAVVNDHALPPLSVAIGHEAYPTDTSIVDTIKQRATEVHVIPATKLASDLGDVRTLNIVMIGCLSVFLPFDLELWQNAVARLVPPKVKELNLSAFNLGRKEITLVSAASVQERRVSSQPA